MLRHKIATSTLDELANGSFQTVIDEIDNINKADVTRLVLCGGKVYYDLLEKRRELGLKPCCDCSYRTVVSISRTAFGWSWLSIQTCRNLSGRREEPKNQGAWLFIVPRLYEDVLKSGKQIRISYAGREASAAPACGSPFACKTTSSARQ